MRLLIVTLLLVHAFGCSRDDDRPLIEDKEAFVDLSVDEQSALVGTDQRLDQSRSCPKRSTLHRPPRYIHAAEQHVF